MPDFCMRTNISKEKFPANFHKELTELLCKVLKKPKEHITVCIYPDSWMTLDGTFDPCARCNLLTGIGNMSPEKNIEYTRALYDKIIKDLELDPKRLIIYFSDVDSNNLAFDGKTVAEIHKLMTTPQ